MKHITFLKKTLIFLLLFILFDFMISIILLNGLNKYYGINRQPDILINGSSGAMSGFNRKDIENISEKKVANYSHEGVSVNEQSAMINHFFQINPDGVKTVIYEVSPVIFSNTSSAENVSSIFYPYMDDNTVDEYIKGTVGIREYYTNKLIRTRRFDARLVRLIMMGYLGKFDNLKTATMDTTALFSMVNKKGKTEIVIENNNIKVFENTMEVIRSNNSNILLVMMPMYYLKLQEFDSNDYENLCRYFKDFCSDWEGVKYLDLNQDSLILNAGYYSDPLHFNVYGQRQITRIICSYLIDN